MYLQFFMTSSLEKHVKIARFSDGEKSPNKNSFLEVLATKFRDVGRWVMKLSISFIDTSNKIAVMYLQFFIIIIWKNNTIHTFFW